MWQRVSKMLPIFVCSFFLSGCLQDTRAIIAPYPSNNHVSIKDNLKGQSLNIKITAMESACSANVPVLTKQDLMIKHKKLKWLREPAVLLDEYIKLLWTDAGGHVKTKESAAMLINLNYIFFDQQTNVYKGKVTIAETNRAIVAKGSTGAETMRQLAKGIVNSIAKLHISITA